MKRVLMILIPTVLLAGGGYAYYATIGCTTGTCPITSSPIVSTLYGALIGAVIGLNLQKGDKPRESQEGS